MFLEPFTIFWEYFHMHVDNRINNKFVICFLIGSGFTCIRFFNMGNIVFKLHVFHTIVDSVDHIS
jgi:hypothetical protein